MRSSFIAVVIILAAGRVSAETIDVSPQIEIVAAGVHLTLVAEHPAVMTPTGIDVDDSGNVWVVCSHTHFRPDDYEGPEHDEVVVIQPDGARRVFYVRTDATMDLELGDDGWVYLAERDRIVRVRDDDGDGVGDREEVLASLQTEADYPHNGLSGLAWHPSGDLVFALGENYWQSWTLTGADGEAVAGTGEGGVFRCGPGGTSLRRVAKGFWNPFGICVRADGTMFAAENDPGARPPCRLLHIVEGGDYGYQRLYGNSPVHPFVCWNGELRGTLPMLHSLGEAPCGIAPLADGLVVPSWTDHRIDFYPLSEQGASFQTERVTLVEGGRQFRPTCITQAAPTVFYLTDWVYGSYKLHGYGRVWKLEIDPDAADWLGPLELPAATPEALLAQRMREGGKTMDDATLFQWARSDDPFLARAALDALAMRSDTFTLATSNRMAVKDRLSLLLAVRQASPTDDRWIRHFLEDPDPDIQFESLRWIADEQLESYRGDLEAMLVDSTIDYRRFEALLATWNTLSGNPRDGVTEPKMLLQRVRDPRTPPRTRAYALRLLDPRHPGLSPELCDELAGTGDRLLIAELTRSLVARGTPDARQRLQRVAMDAELPTAIRADAIAGISPAGEAASSLLLQLAGSHNRTLRDEALRSLRFAELDEKQRTQLRESCSNFESSGDLLAAVIDPESLKKDRPDPSDTEAWQQRLDAIPGSADPAAGRRIFHHAKVGLCANCHRHRGSGNVVGPDLSAASNQGDPHRLLRAVLEPSRDVDPQYYPWTLVTEDGRAFTGILLRDGGGGTEFFRDNQGREQKFLTEEIVTRKPLTTSMMPDGLTDLMTDREIRDLVAFLDQAADDDSGVIAVEDEDDAAEKFLGQ
jgi:putative membrane-bound dehydrogenase-like protein